MGKIINKRGLPASNFTGMPVIQFKPVGKWAETIKTLGRLDPAIKSSSIKAQTKLAKEICKKVKAHLRNQDLGWDELGDKYAQKKEKAGLSGKILIAYKNYYEAIEVWENKGHHMVNVGVKRGKYTRTLSGKRSKLEIAQIAMIHEFSRGRKIPARPLWNPTISEMGGSKGMKKIFMGSFLYWLRMNGLPVKKYRDIL